MATNFSKNGIIQAVIDFFCLVCETNILSKAECEAHMNTAEHEENFSITAYYKEFKEDCIRKIKNKYFCELCNKFLPLLPRVRLHVKDPKHIDNKNIGWLKRVDGAIVAFDKLVIDDTAWHGFSDESCIICNIECDDNDIHKKLPSHILNLLQMKVDFDKDKNIYRKIDEFSFQCLTCNVMQNVKDITNHFDSPTHQHLLEISYETYERSKVCTKLNCKLKDNVNKSVDQTDVCLHSNYQVHVENPTETTKNVFKYTFGDICEEELLKILKVNACTKLNCKPKDDVTISVEQSDIFLPSYNQVDTEYPAEIEQNIPETIKLEPNDENIETNSKDKSKNAAEDIIQKLVKYTFGDICEEELFKILNVKACTKSNCKPKDDVTISVEQGDIRLPSYNQVDTEYPAEIEQNIPETIKLEPNDENIETNSKDKSKNAAEDITQKLVKYTFGDICEEELFKILNVKACTKSNCEPQNIANKSVKQTDVCLLLNNQVDVKKSAESEQNIPDTVKVESNENNAENSKDGLNHEAEEITKKVFDSTFGDIREEELFKIVNAEACTKSNWKAKDSANKSDERTDVCLALKNLVDIENSAETEHNNAKTIELEPNEKNIVTNSTYSSKSNREHNNGVNNSDKQSDVCLLSSNQLDVESPVKIEQNIHETIELESNEETIETNSIDSSKQKCKSKDSVDKSGEQTDICLHLNNQVDKENRAETEQNLSESIALEANAENIESNSKDCSKSNWEANDSVNKSDEQTEVCLPLRNQADIENPAETEQKMYETGKIELNEEKVETNSIDSSKSNCKSNDSVVKSDEQTDIHLNSQVDKENLAETEQNLPESIELEANAENIESNSKDCLKSNWEAIDSVNKSDEQTDVCVPSNNQPDIENTVETEHNNDHETIELEPNDENIEKNSTDSSKSNYETEDGSIKSVEPTDVCLASNNQVHIGNPAETKQNIFETDKIEPNEEKIETNSIYSSKSICEHKNGVNRSDKQSDVCLLLNNQVNIENPAETKQNITETETCKIELNEETIDTNSIDSSKSNCKSKDSVDKSDEESDICVHLNNQGDKENRAYTEQNISESIELEANAENIESNSKDCLKSNWEAIDSVNKSDEQTDACLPSNNQADIENTADTEHNNHETIELEPNNENIESNSTDNSKSNYETEDGIIKSVEPTDVCLPSNNQVRIENPAQTKQNIFETDKIEPNEEKIETNSIDSSKLICEHNNGVNRSDKQSDVCLLSNYQVNIENPAETKQNITETCKIELNEETIETNSIDSSKQKCKSKDSVDKSDEERDICVHLNNQVDKENRAYTEQNISEYIELEANAENIESNSKDCLKSNWEAIDSVNKPDVQTDVCLPSNNQADIENTAETEHNNHETIELEPNDENIERNSTGSSKSNYETEDGIIKCVEPTDVCLASNNQVHIENPAETKQYIFETDKIEPNEEKIETNSIDSSKLICEHNNGVNRSDKQSDVCLLLNNQVNIENPAGTKQNITETCKIELNEETIETNSINSSKSNCKSKDIVDKSDEESDICEHLNNQVDKKNRADTEQNISESIELEANAQNIKSNSKDCSKSNWEAKDSANKSNEETEVFLPSKNQAHLESPAETEHNNPVTIKLKPNEDNIETNSRDGWNHEAEEIRKKVFGYIFGDIREEELFKTLKANACMKSNWEPKDSVNKSDEQTDVCLPSKNQVDIESPAETEQNIPEKFELELNDENIETNSKDGSKDATEETIKNVFEYKGGTWKNEIFKFRKVSDCMTLEKNNKSWCTICNWIVDSSTVAEHLNGRHHKRQKAKRSSKKFANTKICTENNNIDCHEKISNSKSNNNIEISLGMKTAFCKKCSVNLCYGNNFVKRHILEHFEKDKNIDEDSIIFSIEEESVKHETLFSSSVLPECNKIENTSKLNGNESVKIDNIPENDKVRLNDKVRQENTQITEETLIQEINKLTHNIDKVPTHRFIDYLIYAKNSMQGVNFCDIIINNNIYIHYTSFSFITVSRDYFKCHACDEIFTIFTLQEHFLSTKHDVAIRDTPVLVQYVSEFIREIRPGYIHCGYCNAIEPMDDIETHLNSVNHKECKGIASWRLHLYQPLIAKTGFQTVYAKNGISKALSFRNLI